MTSIDGRWFSYVVLLVFLTASQFAHATIDVFPNIFIHPNKITGECFFGIQNEPYSAINADCSTEHRAQTTTRIALVPISGFNIGHPHDTYHPFEWNTLYTGTPVNDDTYCQIFGNALVGAPSSVIDLGHHDDSDQNMTIPGKMKCKVADIPPPPEPICITSFFGCNEQNQPGVFVSFEEPLGYSPINFSVEQQRQGGAWSSIGGLSLSGCVPSFLNFGFFNFRVTMQTQFGSSQCLVVYLNDGSDCDDGEEW